MENVSRQLMGLRVPERVWLLGWGGITDTARHGRRPCSADSAMPFALGGLWHKPAAARAACGLAAVGGGGGLLSRGGAHRGPAAGPAPRTGGGPSPWSEQARHRAGAPTGAHLVDSPPRGLVQHCKVDEHVRHRQTTVRQGPSPRSSAGCGDWYRADPAIRRCWRRYRHFPACRCIWYM